MNDPKKISILFCCMGNICRSPTAHGVFENLIKMEGLSEVIMVDSAGTHAYHVGEPPDLRSQQTAMSHGVDLSSQRARRVESEDFYRFDYILAMDRDNYHNLVAICPDQMDDRLHLFMDFARELQQEEVPDPYYGGKNGFERVFNMIDVAAAGLLDDIRMRRFHSGKLAPEQKK
jgi:low molecular weight protein-tyrosine phosphatase